jgi:hypothetical protein
MMMIYKKILNTDHYYIHFSEAKHIPNKYMADNRVMKVAEKLGKSSPTECDALLVDTSERQHAPTNYDPRNVCGRGIRVFLLVTFSVFCAASFNALISIEKYRGQNRKRSNTLVVQVEGRHKSDDDDVTAKHSDCNDGAYASRTLQLAYELPFASLFKDNKGSRKFEASSVTLSDDHRFAYAICDSSWAVFKFDIRLSPFSNKNMLIGDVDREVDEESGYEALIMNGESLFVVRESIDHSTENGSLDGYHAIIEEIQIVDKSYRIIRKCSAEYEFEGNSKGFEGAAGLKDLDGNLVILGLCEGNHCSESKKDDIGNGRIVIMRQEISPEDGSCLWRTIRKLHIPHSAAFKDYSAISITASGKVGITSQENSQFWVGRLLGQQDEDRWDVDKIRFDDSDSLVYDFPKDNSCTTVYCNIEGIHWINEDMVIAVSDKMKGHGKQDFRCFEKDQSAHVFMLPD